MVTNAKKTPPKTNKKETPTNIVPEKLCRIWTISYPFQLLVQSWVKTSGLFILAWDYFLIFASKIGMEWSSIFHWHFVLMKVCFSSLLTASSLQNTHTHIHILHLKEEICLNTQVVFHLNKGANGTESIISQKEEKPD